MENINICKFNFNVSNDLICSVFVLETTDAQLKTIKNPEYTLAIVLDGEGELTVENKTFSLNKGMIFFVCKGENFSIKKNTMEYAYINFRGRRAAEYIDRLNVSSFNRIFDGCENLIDLWKTTFLNISSKNVDLYAEAILLYSMAQLQPESKEENNVISQILRITEEKFSDSSLSLDYVSKKVGYNDKYISMLFKKEKSVTYTQYLRDLRIAHSLFLIEQGVESVKNIAFLSGFSDALYFSKVFKKLKGITPKTYINNFKNLR